MKHRPADPCSPPRKPERARSSRFPCSRCGQRRNPGHACHVAGQAGPGGAGRRTGLRRHRHPGPARYGHRRVRRPRRGHDREQQSRADGNRSRDRGTPASARGFRPVCAGRRGGTVRRSRCRAAAATPRPPPPRQRLPRTPPAAGGVPAPSPPPRPGRPPPAPPLPICRVVRRAPAPALRTRPPAAPAAAVARRPGPACAAIPVRPSPDLGGDVPARVNRVVAPADGQLPGQNGGGGQYTTRGALAGGDGERGHQGGDRHDRSGMARPGESTRPAGPTRLGAAGRRLLRSAHPADRRRPSPPG